MIKKKVKMFTEEQEKIGEAMVKVIEEATKTFRELGEAFRLVAILHKGDKDE
jgi:predicted RNA binding protein with dsRBD fold (UPF0201 family)